MRWKSRTSAFAVCFTAGVIAAFAYAAFLGLFLRKHAQPEVHRPAYSCEAGMYFAHPDEVLAALKHTDVNVRRDMFQRLFVRPSISTVYYDYERDLNYPERPDRLRLEYVQLDDSPESEAILSFVRFDQPVALVLKKEACGWRLVGALSSWLSFEDYPYVNWVTLPETVTPGVHEVLLRESFGDATSYERRARLLKLTDVGLTQIAEFKEESLTPVEEYGKADWNDVKLRQIGKATFNPGRLPQIAIETTEEVVTLNGAPPSYSYWLETDGSWHTVKRNWISRPSQIIKHRGHKVTVLKWNKQEARFVE